MRKLLVANRGEIARRVCRTSRALGIATVAVYTEPDAGLPFVRESDEAVPVDSYLSAEALVEAAVRTGADAVHPGYGFLAEDASFARRCADAELVWVGPPPEAMAAMGSKLAARELAASLGIPVLSGEQFPALVKASAGGGGRGMRIVRSQDDVEAALESARREAGSAFGDGDVFLEPFVEGARHIEVQVLGDTHGTVTHLFERECSVQRRYQKVIEETPVLGAELRAVMTEAAVRLAQAIDYVGVGTVEFLLAPDGDFFFLEANTRLQVEHPVTEAVTGLDLVALQLRIAEGAPLPREAVEARLDGHAIEARLYAEDPAAGFLPQTGVLHRFRIDGDVRVDAGVEDGSTVSPHYDALLAKVIAWAPTRDEAARKLAAALRGARIHGVQTNRDLLVAVLEHPEFLSGGVDTQFLERLDLTVRPLFDERLHAAAAALAGQAARRAGALLPSGWRNVPSQLHRTRFEGFDVGYRLGHGLALEVDGERIADARLHACAPDAVELETEGVRRRYEVHLVGGTAFVDSALGSSTLVELDRFPEPAEETAAGALVAPMPGAVVRVDVAPGEEVVAGQSLVVVEAMKMEHTIAAPHAGRVSAVHVEAGEQVDGGRVVVVLEELE
ncbi:MAG TPA: biotin carboxylase N-terminal domain-containing protein [Gaiellaceae bacterium]